MPILVRNFENYKSRSNQSMRAQIMKEIKLMGCNTKFTQASSGSKGENERFGAIWHLTSRVLVENVSLLYGCVTCDRFYNKLEHHFYRTKKQSSGNI